MVYRLFQKGSDWILTNGPMDGWNPNIFRQTHIGWQILQIEQRREESDTQTMWAHVGNSMEFREVFQDLLMTHPQANSYADCYKFKAVRATWLKGFWVGRACSKSRRLWNWTKICSTYASISRSKIVAAFCKWTPARENSHEGAILLLSSLRCWQSTQLHMVALATIPGSRSRVCSNLPIIINHAWPWCQRLRKLGVDTSTIKQKWKLQTGIFWAAPMTLRAQHWWNMAAFGTSGFSGPGTWADKLNALTILDRPEMNASLHVKTPEDPERSEKGFRRM